MTQHFRYPDSGTHLERVSQALGLAECGAVPFGVIGDTPVLTPAGQVLVSALTPGAMVETFEDGPKEIRAIIQRRAWGNRLERGVDFWPFEVPVDVLDNIVPLRLMPHQVVVFECDLIEKMTGDPFVLMPVKALDGFGGIKAVEPEADQVIYELKFDQPQALCAAGGTYVLNDKGLSLDVATGRRFLIDGCKALSLEKARILLAHMDSGLCNGCEGRACNGRELAVQG